MVDVLLQPSVKRNADHRAAVAVANWSGLLVVRHRFIFVQDDIARKGVAVGRVETLKLIGFSELPEIRFPDRIFSDRRTKRVRYVAELQFTINTCFGSRTVCHQSAVEN